METKYSIQHNFAHWKRSSIVTSQFIELYTRLYHPFICCQAKLYAKMFWHPNSRNTIYSHLTESSSPWIFQQPINLFATGLCYLPMVSGQVYLWICNYTAYIKHFSNIYISHHHECNDFNEVIQILSFLWWGEAS